MFLAVLMEQFNKLLLLRKDKNLLIDSEKIVVEALARKRKRWRWNLSGSVGAGNN